MFEAKLGTVIFVIYFSIERKKQPIDDLFSPDCFYIKTSI